MDIAQSKVGIANLALTRLEAKIISSFNEGSSEANAISVIYNQCRDECLESYPWTFATLTAALQTLAITPVDFGDGITISYAYPNQFLKPHPTIPFNFSYALIRFESTGILSDTAGLLMKYIFQNDNPSTYSAKFCKALAAKLSYELCFKLTNASQYAQVCQMEFEEKIEEAKSSDAQLGTPIEPRQDEWFNSRLQGSGNNIVKPNGNIGFITP